MLALGAIPPLFAPGKPASQQLLPEEHYWVCHTHNSYSEASQMQKGHFSEGMYFHFVSC